MLHFKDDIESVPATSIQTTPQIVCINSEVINILPTQLCTPLTGALNLYSFLVYITDWEMNHKVLKPDLCLLIHTAIVLLTQAQWDT